EQNFSINLVLQNVGSNNAAAIIDSIVIPEFNLHLFNGKTISADSTLSVTPISAQFDTTVVGDTLLTVRVKWRDENILSSNQTDSIRTITVLKKANLKI
ncbi:MAG: hypothetical protein GWN00_16240, partial [Aliifodinibius sp.]|nr:hypothetical protein [Fodinibius sp.]NIV12595.1 hypothetical protein [Fodinibius sp.]NIY26297.1 hypothetical protein [Fodinibius sp.]